MAGNCSFYRDLLALIGTIQERDDLCTGAAIGGAERGSGRAVGHAVLHLSLIHISEPTRH